MITGACFIDICSKGMCSNGLLLIAFALIASNLITIMQMTLDQTPFILLICFLKHNCYETESDDNSSYDIQSNK